LLAVGLATALAIATIAPAGEAPQQSPSSTLKWRPRGSVKRASAQTDAATPETFKARRAAATQAVVPAGGRTSRARLRDSIMQVSSDQPLNDPFDDPDAKRAEGQPTEPAEMPAMPSDDEKPLREPAPLQTEEAPSYQEAIPQPPGPSESGVVDLPGDLSRGLSTPGATTCEEYHSECSRAGREMQKRDITQVFVGLDIQGVENEDFPCECPLLGDAYTGRNFGPTTFTWKATGVCHKPLYFEDVQLERYGHSWSPVVQPFMSAAHFFISVPLLPYKMGLTPPNECIYTLGYYRPGSCAPYVFEPIPLSLRGALFEAAGATAFTFWFWPP
jgi:hypothetical protein